MQSLTAQEIYAQLYDAYVENWPGEVDFYRELIAHLPPSTSRVLEIACGTGQITLQLAKEGVNMTGLDISPQFLGIARQKSRGKPTVKWILGDITTFELGERFDAVIIPGHSFQVLNRPDEQVKCLAQIKRHLLTGGFLVIHLDHQDISWLAQLLDKKQSACRQSRLLAHPMTGEMFRQNYMWTFEPSTQTTTVTIIWEKLDNNQGVAQRWEMDPMQLHCIFRFEMEHLLGRVGFSVEAVYGDFFKNQLTNESEQMIWVARNMAK